MKKFYIGAAVAAAILGSMSAQACDCTISKNWSNPACKGKTPKLPSGSHVTGTVTGTQTQGQGQTQSSTNTQGQGQTNGNNTNTSSSASAGGASHSVSSSVSAGGSATATGGAGGTAAASDNSTGSGNDTNYNSSYQVPKQTPPAFAGTVQPTSSCKNARNGGASAPVAGISFGWSTSDDECDLRETAREFHEMGQDALAVNLLCQSKAARRLAECTYISPERPVAAQVHPAGEAPVTQAELREVERRILQQAVSK